MAERIGDSLLETKALQPSQADEVARAQKGGDKRSFGAIAVSLGFVVQGAIDAFLAAQGK